MVFINISLPMDLIEMSFCDSANIIFISYHGGAAGFALKVLLSFSPECKVTLTDTQIREDGAAHCMAWRYDLQHSGGMIDSMYSMHREFGIATDFIEAVHGPNADESFIDKIRNRFNTARTLTYQKPDDTQDLLLMADHIPPRFIKRVFPHATIIRLNRNLWSSNRAYFLKNLMQFSRDDQSRFKTANQDQYSIDSILDEQGLTRTYSNYKKVLKKTHMVRCIERTSIHNDDTAGLIDIDYDDIFSSNCNWRATYKALTVACGITSQENLANEFIRSFRSKQYDRRTHLHDDRWDRIRDQDPANNARENCA